MGKNGAHQPVEEQVSLGLGPGGTPVSRLNALVEFCKAAALINKESELGEVVSERSSTLPDMHNIGTRDVSREADPLSPSRGDKARETRKTTAKTALPQKVHFNSTETTTTTLFSSKSTASDAHRTMPSWTTSPGPRTDAQLQTEATLEAAVAAATAVSKFGLTTTTTGVETAAEGQDKLEHATSDTFERVQPSGHRESRRESAPRGPVRHRGGNDNFERKVRRSASARRAARGDGWRLRWRG